MRKNTFGDAIIEATSDDLGEALVAQGVEPEGVYAEVMFDDDADAHYFEIRDNEDGESSISSDPIFADKRSAKMYLRSWLSDIQ